MGQKVGAGECWDLADQALRAAGAASSTTTGPDDDYVWGDKVIPAGALPGDVVQFRDYVATVRTTTDITFDDGSSSSGWTEEQIERPHHTAVVESTGRAGLVVLEQNVDPGGKKVQRHTIAITPGTTTTSTPQTVKADDGKMKAAKVTITVTVTISGKIWVYRPKAK
ncbi:MAG TPA: hypothetical protein VMT03_09980 [Polyangia bacterium]|nr:hypothetical protein [Polyangia bacterium]